MPLLHHTDLNRSMWAQVVQWMRESTRKMQLLDETLHRAVSILVEHLRVTPDVPCTKLQLAAVSALIAACKLHEPTFMCFDEWVRWSHNAITVKELRDAERDLITSVRLLRQTAYQCMMRRTMHGGAGVSETEEGRKAMLRLQRSLLDFDVCLLPAEEVAEGCLLLARTKHNTRLQSSRISSSAVASSLLCVGSDP